MATIKEVAKRAGVSITTVSRALNNYSDVNVTTKQNILNICRELNYTPNSLARNLALKQSKVIGFLFSDIKETDMNGNIIFRLLLGARAQCDAQGYELIMLFTNRKEQEKKSLEQLYKERNLGGLVLYGLKTTDPYGREMVNFPYPCVAIDMANAPVTVCTNNDLAVEEIINLFYARGKRHIGMINGAFDAEVSHARESGYIRAMRKKNLEIPRKNIRYADFFKEKAYEETKTLLEDCPNIDAIFAASDLMAIGVMDALQDMGQRIPEDVAVAGIDGIQVGAYLKPALTTVLQDFKEMGRRAVSLLIDIQAGKQVGYIEYVDYQLLERGSV